MRAISELSVNYATSNIIIFDAHLWVNDLWSLTVEGLHAVVVVIGYNPEMIDHFSTLKQKKVLLFLMIEIRI